MLLAGCKYDVYGGLLQVESWKIIVCLIYVVLVFWIKTLINRSEKCPKWLNYTITIILILIGLAGIYWSKLLFL